MESGYEQGSVWGANKIKGFCDLAEALFYFIKTLPHIAPAFEFTPFRNQSKSRTKHYLHYSEIR
jgi:hypothetical protein